MGSNGREGETRGGSGSRARKRVASGCSDHGDSQKRAEVVRSPGNGVEKLDRKGPTWERMGKRGEGKCF